MDAEQIRVIDRVARRVTEAATLAAIDDQVIDAAHTRTPKQLQVWLLRLVVRLEPLAFETHRRALAERRSIVQGAGSAFDPSPCKAPTASATSPAKYRLKTPQPSTACSPPRPAASAPHDPRTDQQRRSDLFADLLLGRLTYDDTDHHDGDDDPSEDREPAQVVDTEWLEIENIDPDTGELLGTHLQPIDADGQPSRRTRRRRHPPPSRTDTQAGAAAPHNPDRCGGAALQPAQ